MKLIESMRRRGLKQSVWLVLVALILGVVVFRAKFAAVPVTAHRITPGAMTAEVMGTGTLEARIKTTISPRIQERLAEVLVDQNDFVKAGQLLARLDDGELKQQVEMAEAALAAARASVERIKADEARAQAVMKQAQLDHQRETDLLATKVSAQAEFDKALERLRVAEADVKRGQAANIEAERQVVTAEKNLLYQQERLGYVRLTSPYDGLVVRRDRDPGSVVVPGSSILQLISTNEIWIAAWVDESAMAGLASGQPARIVFRSEPTKSYCGEVARLGRETDRETREFLVDVRLKELPQNWTIGQRAEVFIETVRKASSITVPQPFIQWRDGRSGVYVNDHGKARWRAVTLGLSGGGRMEIVQGLAAEEQVVRRAGSAKQELMDGQRIKAL